MVRVAIVGFGFMGKMHFNTYKNNPDAEIVAICDADEERLKSQTGTVGNISGTEEPIDLTGIALYTDYQKMLAEANLDAVSITLPTFLHPDFTCQALLAGIHVLCEKPMALTLAECDRMIDAAQQTGKVLQVGHCVRFWPEYQKTKELIDSKTYGDVLAASFRRLSIKPTWSSDNWLMNEQRSGGMELDLHIHDTDYIDYLFGTPHAVCSVGTRGESGGLSHIMTHYHYDDNKSVFAEGGWLMKAAFGFEMSFIIMLEKATILFDCTREPAFKVCPEEGDAFTPDVAPGDGYSAEIAHFLRAVQGGNVPPIVTVESSRNSIRIVEAEKQSAQKKQPVTL
jgi:1,5-anhydro-D-fructose reductase (1,5-anhydro-D-mannitol-forming)